MVYDSLKKPLTLCLPILLVMVFCVCTSAQAQTSVVVSKTSPNTASESDVKAFFAGSKFQWPNGSKIQIVDQPNTQLADDFYSNFVGRSVNQIRKTWTKLLLSGQAEAPIKCADDEEVKKAVASNPNSIGFISSSSLDGTVKEIVKIE